MGNRNKRVKNLIEYYKNERKFDEFLKQFSEEDINNIEKSLSQNIFDGLSLLGKQRTTFHLINIINGKYPLIEKEQVIIKLENSIGLNAINKLKELYLKYKDIIDNENNRNNMGVQL
jgi:hypothetical protein